MNNQHTKTIVFVTGNKRKIWQAEQALNPLGIRIIAKDLPVVEIQSPIPIEITRAKARSAYDITNEPLIVCDHSWAIPALNGFPGGYMKDINHWFEPEDFLALIRDKQDRSIVLTEMIVYTDGTSLQEFSAEYHGKIINAPRGRGHFAQERIVVYDGHTKTIAEAIDANENARDMKDSAWQKFGDWFSRL